MRTVLIIDDQSAVRDALSLLLSLHEIRPLTATMPEEGLALRGSFIINPEGEIKVEEIHDLGIGRDAKELLRKVQAAQYVASHPGEVCPAKWTPGANTLKPSLDLVGKI